MSLYDAAVKSGQAPNSDAEVIFYEMHLREVALAHAVAVSLQSDGEDINGQTVLRRAHAFFNFLNGESK